MKYKVAIAAAALLTAMSAAHAAGDPVAGKAKSATCAACHGADGNSVNPQWPKLAGQHASYIEKELHDFKSGARTNPTMSPMAKPLSDDDINNLAAYFSQQTMSIGKADKSLVAKGEKIYRGGNSATGVAACMACHGPDGAGNPAAKFPRLGGQHAPYVVAQLEAFKSGARSNDAGKMMRNIASKMTDDEIKAVASYIEGLHAAK
ncbi:MAG TPA: c-type cytochrome [Gammaproteobacteria bacterium]|nr:c-type cytochrome [Gammaproteobacteria bacterium]